MGQDSYRVMHKFWLDAVKDDELALIEELTHRKKERRYSAAIRDGLRLLFTLEQGDTSELERQFPGIVQASRHPSPDSSGGGESDSKEVTKDDLKETRQALEQLIHDTLNTPGMKGNNGGGLPPIDTTPTANLISAEKTIKPNAQVTGDAFMADRGNLFG